MGIRNKALSLFFLSFAVAALPAAAADNTREPSVAGSFYPSDPAVLRKTIGEFIAKAPAPETVSGTLKILIVPHAGYQYSGQTAAAAYRLLAGKSYDTVVLIGPCHRALFKGASIWTSGSWKTPLGEVPVDEPLALSIAGENSAFRFSTDAHAIEHSLEVQLPFLQSMLGTFKVVPILVSDASPENTQALAYAIFKNLRDKNALVVVSSDMSHYFPDETARRMDALTLGTMKALDAEALYADLESRKSELCGHAAVLTALRLSALNGRSKLRVLSYATTADSTGDKSRVVGYGASAIYEESAGPALTAEQKKALLRLARGAVEHFVVSGTTVRAAGLDPALQEKRAAFVTLRKNGELRGCIGDLLPREALELEVRDMAVQAATADRRFQPVKPDELGSLTYEISVLSVPEKISSVDAIRLGTHGVIVRNGSRSGVFLPKVAEELAYDRDRFLSELCTQKAGLPADCWQKPGTEWFVFTADEFGESGPAEARAK